MQIRHLLQASLCGQIPVPSPFTFGGNSLTSCHLCREALLSRSIYKQFITWSLEFFDRQYFSKHWTHGKVINEILVDGHNGNRSLRERKQHGSCPEVSSVLRGVISQETPRRMRQKWASASEVSSEWNKHVRALGVERNSVSSKGPGQTGQVWIWVLGSCLPCRSWVSVRTISVYYEYMYN